MNRVRVSDLEPPVEITAPSLGSDIPNDEELDALCDLSMRLDDQEQADTSRAA